MKEEGGTKAPVRHPLNFNHPDFFASLKINPVMFVIQSLCVAAFMLGLFAAVIIAAALMGVL